MSIPTKNLEFLMEAWRDHSKTGFHVTFLVNPSDQEFFKSCPDGQRFAVVLVKLTDQEEPAPLPTPADLKREEAKRMKAAEAEAKAHKITVAELAAQAPLPIAAAPSKAEEASKEPATVDTKPRETPANTEVSEHKEPAKPHFPGGLCGLAVRWCDDEHFQLWLDETFNDAFARAAIDAKSPEEQAKATVCEVCAITSRKELDTNESAAQLFKGNIMEPYKGRREEDGVDDEAPF